MINLKAAAARLPALVLLGLLAHSPAGWTQATNRVLSCAATDTCSVFFVVSHHKPEVAGRSVTLLCRATVVLRVAGVESSQDAYTTTNATYDVAGRLQIKVSIPIKVPRETTWLDIASYTCSAQGA